MGWFTLDASELDKLQEAMNKSLLYPGPIVDSVLRNEGANLIKRNITMLLPTSGRKWKGVNIIICISRMTEAIRYTMQGTSNS